MKPMRLNLWNNILEDLGPPEGCIVPLWLVATYCLIFPEKGLRHLLDRSSPVDLFTYTWTINGVRYSGRFFDQIGLCDGRWFRAVRHSNGLVSLQWRILTAEADECDPDFFFRNLP